MNTTPDLPDEPVQRIMAEATLEGRVVRAETAILSAATPTPEQWLADWLRRGEETLRGASPAPTATEILNMDRSCLESR